MKNTTTLALTCTLALVAFGVLMVYSTSAVGGDGLGLLPRQLVYVALGLAAMFFAARFDYHRLKSDFLCRLIVLTTVSLLVLVLIPGVGIEVDGAQRWLGFGGFRFQPSELAKFALILLLAVKMTDNQEHIHRFFRGFLPPLLLSGAFAGMVLAERDLGVPVMLMGVAFVMMCAAGVRWRYLMVSLAPMGAAVYGLILIAPHRLERLVAFLDPWSHRDEAGWQLIQSLSAFAQGGLTGRGAGAGEQKLGYLPAAHTDFIFAVIGEEFGLMGSTSVVLLFAFLTIAAFMIAMNAADLFGCLLATGIGTIIAMQAAFIMAVTTGLLPTKGLPLPFISYGGTALIVFMGLTGVLANIGAQGQGEEKKSRLIPAT